ncbi:nitrite reductase small subunit NirD [Streptomyces sp. NPDC001380]|uniref:nitrite reductase small subunit NirD n=1 Tax=Streptomyces sp. NPDC001380 TaxID=3364566 RepID=UPI0036B5CE70
MTAPTAAPAASPAVASPADPGTARVELLTGGAWVPVCDWPLLTPGRGVAVLLPDGRQAAVFRDRRDRVWAVGNRDPFTGAHVLSRGLLGSAAGGGPYVASPLLKQRFDLATGVCLDDPSVRIPVHAVRLAD